MRATPGAVRTAPVACQPRSLALGFLFMVVASVSLSASLAHAQVDCSATSTTGVPQVECEALMALYVSTDGTNWTDNSNWNTASAVSTWFGVGVSGGQVSGVSLDNNQLIGTIPPELGNLSSLISLQLSGNQLTGTLPPELGNLTNLTTLRLASNQLTGPLPPELGNLTNLTTLYGYSNQLTGAIPPELGNLASLTSLHLSNNQLTGTLPPELENLASLTALYLYGNQLTGTIPAWLGNLTNLTTLYLSANQFTGTIPSEIGNLTNLRTLYLYGNQLTGTLPAWLGNLVNLTSLHLGNNQLTGPIPPEIGNLTNLVSMFMYGNQLLGGLPPEIGNLVNLTTLYLTSCQLTGPIPPELGNLTSLDTLFLSNNQLTGPIPPELGNLTSLTSAYLYSNQLTGSIPPELGNLTNLDTLYLRDNQLTGPIPSEFGNLANLTDLWLSGNQLSGDIPDLTALPLTSLYFGGNAFVFADFEAEFLAYNDGTPATFQYGSQSRVDTARTENFPSGAPALVPSAVAINPSGNDQYQWYKDGAPIAAPYGTARDLDVTLGSGGVAAAQAGNYHYTITNAVVTGLTLTSQVIAVAVSATCGDGFVNDPSEICDDGNLNTGDGCNAACLLEVGEPCTGDTDCASNLCNVAAMPPVCAPPVGCGNGVLEAGEACDDGNNVNGDGCTAACQIEDGNPCTANAECSSDVCDMTEAPPLCEPAGFCGNGVLDVPEGCDDGNTTAGDGCSDVCLLEDGEPCANDAQCKSTICDTIESDACEPANSCGNGALEAGEACDDGNAEAADGCGAGCLFELGAGPCTDHAQCGSGVCNTMAATPVCAAPIGCGNSVLNDDEVCDDGNLKHGDGCSQSCTLENTWRGGGGCAVGGSPWDSGIHWLVALLGLGFGFVRSRRRW